MWPRGWVGKAAPYIDDHLPQRRCINYFLVCVILHHLVAPIEGFVSQYREVGVSPRGRMEEQTRIRMSLLVRCPWSASVPITNWHGSSSNEKLLAARTTFRPTNRMLPYDNLINFYVIIGPMNKHCCTTAWFGRCGGGQESVSPAASPSSPRSAWCSGH